MTAARISVLLSTYSPEDPQGWDHVFDIARAADLAGVDRLMVSDHVVFGEHLDAYGNPQTGGIEGGRQPTGPDGHWLEPLTVLTAVAAQTDRIRLGTYILLAALRRPAVLAKQVATLDVLSGGRVDLGVGVGWQREEYDAAGLDFATRGRLLDHTLDVCRTLWSEQAASYSSPELTFAGIHQMPKPAQPGGVPIWVSGRCNPAVARRLARFGQGWIPWADDASDPLAAIPRMRAEVEQAGGDTGFGVLVPLPVPRRENGGADYDAAAERLAEFASAGVTDVLVHLRVPRSFTEAHDAYAELVGALRVTG